MMHFRLDIICRLLIFALASGFILMFCASESSMLFPQYDYDYAVFKAIGQGWNEGLIPYKDMFDHKGPILYLIQLIGIKLYSGKTGIWILELICSVISFELIYKIGIALRSSKKLIWLTILICYLGLAAYVDGGNTVEEWSLPFQLVSVLLLIKCIYNDGNIKLMAFYLGLCFGAVAMIRINNNCTICGIVLGMSIYLSKEKRWKDFASSCITFICGAVCVIVPFIIYFYFNNAIDDFIYCNLTFNLLYKAVWVNEYGIANMAFRIISLSPCIILTLLSIIGVRMIAFPLRVCFIMIGVITFVVFITGASYLHYYIMVIPTIALSMLIVHDKGIVVKNLIFLLLAIPVTLRCYKLYDLRKENILQRCASADQYEKKELFDIPINDMARIYVYDDYYIGSKLTSQGRLPVGKFFFLQKQISNVDSALLIDMKNSFNRSDPKWIISTVPISEMVILNSMNGWSKIMTDSLNDKTYYIYNKL